MKTYRWMLAAGLRTTDGQERLLKQPEQEPKPEKSDAAIRKGMRSLKKHLQTIDRARARALKKLGREAYDWSSLEA